MLVLFGQRAIRFLSLLCATGCYCASPRPPIAGGAPSLTATVLSLACFFALSGFRPLLVHGRPSTDIIPAGRA